MRILCILFISLGVTCFGSQSLYGQSGSPVLTVEESVRLGLEHNFRLQAARADVEEAEAARRQSRAARLPVISGTASYMRLSDNIPEVDFTLPGTDTTFTILPIELNQIHSQLSVEQPLFTGGRLNRQIEAASRQADAAGLMEQQEQADVAFEIRRAYWNLYRAQITQETIEAALTQVDEHLRNVQNRVEEGTALRTELLSVQTRRSEVLLDQVDARSMVRVARLELNRLIGLPSDSETELTEPEITATSFGLDESEEHILEQRPGLQALSEQIRAQEAELRAIQGGWLPEVSLVGRYTYARPNQYFFAEQDQFRGTWEAGVALRWNIWSGGQRIHETSRARARLRSAEAGFEDMKDQLTIAIERQYLELDRSAEAIEVTTMGVEAAEEEFRSARQQFEEGVALSSQVLDAEYAYRTAQSRHAEAMAGYEIARASVLHALGKVWGDADEF